MIKVFSTFKSLFENRSFTWLLRKNWTLVYGYPLLWFSKLTPRSKNKWAFGSNIGFTGNSKYFFLFCIGLKPACIWIASDKQTAKQLSAHGYKSYYKWSLYGIYHSLTASVYICSDQLTDINYWTSGRVKYINLWHGVGIKNIMFKQSSKQSNSFIKEAFNEKNLLSRIYSPYFFRRPDLFLSTSPLMTAHFSECFKIDTSSCFECIYPRCELLFWDKEKLKQFISDIEDRSTYQLVETISSYKKVYIYMPTWRDLKTDFLSDSEIDFIQLNKILEEKSYLLLLKLHPLTKINKEELISLPNIMLLNNDIDIYPLLPFTDVLITDYSSIYYDYLLMKDKNILLFPFDYHEYITKDRDFAFDFDEYTPGRRAMNFEELLSNIREDTSLEFAEREWVFNQFWNYKNSTIDLYNKINSLVNRNEDNVLK